MEDREIVALVDQEFENALGSPDGEISRERAEAWRYYNSELLGNEVPGKSQVVTSEVSDVIDGIMPSLMKIFFSEDNLLKFEPEGPEDERLARQETEYTNHVFFKKTEDPFLLLHSWFFDALTQKNGYVQCSIDESEEVTEETYTDLDEIELTALLNDDELEAVERDEKQGETVINGLPVEATLYDVRFKRTKKNNRIVIENVPPEELRISSDSRKPNTKDCRMVGRERDIRRSELIEMGFDAKLVMSLPETGRDWDSEEEIARRSYDEDRESTVHPLNQEVEIREAYIYLPVGKNKTELRQVFTSNGRLLDNSPADRSIYHTLTAKPLPHKHFGRSVAELVMDIMKIKTTLLRQTLDNLYQSNQPGHYVWEQALSETTMDDLLTTEIGRVVVGDRPPGEAIAPLAVPFTAQSSFGMMEYFDGMVRDRTGYHSEGDSLDPEALKNIQRSVLTQAIDMSKDKIYMIARIFAETGLKSLFLHIHELIRKHNDKISTFKLRGEWIPVDPASWRTREDITANIGLGIASRESNLIHLNNIFDKQRDIVQAGGLGLIVTPQNIFQTAAQMVRNANLPNPEAFFTDPGDKTAPDPSPQALQLQQQQQELLQRQQQIDLGELQIKRERLQLDAEKVRQSGEKLDDDFSLKMDELNNQITEMELKYGVNLPGGA